MVTDCYTPPPGLQRWIVQLDHSTLGHRQECEVVKSGGLPLEETREEMIDCVPRLDMSVGAHIIHRANGPVSGRGGCRGFLSLLLECHQKARM